MGLAFVVLCLAAYRATRLVVADGITQPLRDWVIERTGPESAWSYLIECMWCVGVWVSGGLTAAAVAAGVDLPAPGLVWLAVAAAVGLIGANFDAV